MTEDLIEQALTLMKAQRYGEALPILRRAIDHDPSNWNTSYLVGQCCRFLDDIEGAIHHLSHASELKIDEPSVFLALGIAFQLNNQWDEAIEAFRRAIEINSDFASAYNSLALTQKKRGDLSKALHNYDAGVKALARQIVKVMSNSRTSPILKHRNTVGSLWLEYIMEVALFLVSSEEGINNIAFPRTVRRQWRRSAGEKAMEEERTEEHAGLCWYDTSNEKGENTRVFLPNFFNTFREEFKHNPEYSNLIGNRGTVLELLGRDDEARLHFDEATEFLP